MLGLPVAKAVADVLRRLPCVLPECKAKVRLGVGEIAAKRAQPLPLVVCQRVHRVDDHSADARLGELAAQMLAIQVKQDWIQKAFGLAAGGAGGDHDIHIVAESALNGGLLVGVQCAVQQRGRHAVGRAWKEPRGEIACADAGLEIIGGFGEWAFQQRPLPLQRLLERISQRLVPEVKRRLQVIDVAALNEIFPNGVVVHRATPGASGFYSDAL